MATEIAETSQFFNYNGDCNPKLNKNKNILINSFVFLFLVKLKLKLIQKSNFITLLENCSALLLQTSQSEKK